MNTEDARMRILSHLAAGPSGGNGGALVPAAAVAAGEVVANAVHASAEAMYAWPSSPS